MKTNSESELLIADSGHRNMLMTRTFKMDVFI